MGLALYRQYRPKKLAEVVGQEYVTDTLGRALATDKIAHAYLFTGPRGTGKTSIARILAHEINDLPYTDDSMHLDIIEIDAASNRRIDEIRELRDKVNIAPSLAKYKVYIIDEVHMLTREAFNALLKTLEEPPAHVVFILATTDAHKLPETIISRTQRFMFKPVDLAKVAAHLRQIAEAESIAIDDEALELIAACGEGSFRDSISLLDQARGLIDGKRPVDVVAVRSLVGIPAAEAITDLAQAITQADAVAVTHQLATLYGQGYAAPQIAKQLGRYIRQQVITGSGQSAAGSLQLLERLIEVPAAHDPGSYLELVVLGQALSGIAAPAAAPAPNARSSAPAATATASVASTTVVLPAHSPAPALVDSTPPAQSAGSAGGTIDADIWPQVVGSLKKTHNTLYGIIRMAKPVFLDDAIELHFGFAFHKKRLSEAKNQAVVVGVIKAITGRELGLRCVLDSKSDAKPAAMATATVMAAATNAPASVVAAISVPAPPAVDLTDNPLTAISNIFGGAEVLES